MALKPEQLVAIEYMSQPNNGGKTIIEIAKECGVTDRTIRNWVKDPEFDEELRKQTKMNVSKLVPDVIKAMYDTSVKEGNAAAAKLILTMAGMLTDKIEVESKGGDKAPDMAELKRMLSELE